MRQPQDERRKASEKRPHLRLPWQSGLKGDKITPLSTALGRFTEKTDVGLNLCRNPRFGGRKGLPQLFRFGPISPFSSNLSNSRSLFSWICSDLFRILPICSSFQNKTGKPLSATPPCKSPTLADLLCDFRIWVLQGLLGKDVPGWAFALHNLAAQNLSKVANILSYTF